MYKYHKTYHKSSHICECENRSLLLKGRRRGQKSVLTELDWAERVSVLLGHQSVRITEKHYAPWVRSRQEQLEADLARAWSRDPLVLSQGEVHGRYTEQDDPVTPPFSTRQTGARGGSRTPMRKNPRRILSPQRLPFRHPGQGRDKT